MEHPEGKYAWTVKAGEKGQFVINRGIAIPPKNMFAHLMETIFNQNAPKEDEE